ncbi:hypothetical protein [Victivallis sp.]|uniref:hypothetical protein n=1 Tax=Victivallis sp. TaxID=2049020 RepID=UPI0025D2671B|nr:hypothetical protein [uncultured Victivallis sp.]
MEQEERVPEPVGFWGALRGTCCGTEIFSRLRYNSVWRTLWHLLLMTLLVSAGIVWGEGTRMGRVIDEVERRITAEFGSEIRMTPEALIPAVRPEEARSLDLPWNGRISYVPDFKAGMAVDPDSIALLDYLVIWSPRFLGCAWQVEPGNWQFGLERPTETEQAAPAPGTVPLFRGIGLSFRSFSTRELCDFLSTGVEVTALWPRQEPPEIPVASLFDAVASSVALLVFLGRFAGLLLLALLYTLIFAGVSRLSLGGRKVVLNFAQFWKVGVYAGFPVMLVAGCFPALDLPFFSYSTVFMIGLVIYWMIAAARLERSGSESNEENFR